MGSNNMRNADVDEEVNIGRAGSGPRSFRSGRLYLPAIALLSASLTAVASAQKTVDLPAGPGPLTNPLKGYAAYAAAGESHHLPASMVYVDASWAELEPRENEYRFADWERREWETPLAKGKHVVFRVWMDYPSQVSGVPQWLVDKGVKMTPYSDFGGGRSPDYEDPRLQEALLRLIKKLGERYDQDPRVAFVQVGLLGHWGEFHTYPRPELFASETTLKRVVGAMRSAFSHKKLMGRNPTYPSLQLPGMGFHDDMIPEDTLPPEDWKFIPALRAGKMDGNWKDAPTGGEMVPGAALKWLGEGWPDTQRAVREAHLSWIGPYCPALVAPPNETYRQRGEELIRMLGYEYRLTKLTVPSSITAGEPATVALDGLNQGVAPFYYAWPVELALLDSQGKVAAKTNVAADIRKWQPGPFHLRAAIPTNVTPGNYRLALGIVDPWTGKPSVAFANRLAQSGGYTILNSITIDKKGSRSGSM
jgi:hypothetical protein